MPTAPLRRFSLLAAILSIATLTASAPTSTAQTTPARTTPARNLPTPATVSPQMQQAIAPAWSGSTAPVTMTPAQWKAMIKAANDEVAASVASMKQHFHVSVEEKTIAGVHVFTVKPETIPSEHRNRLLVHVHGGGYIVFAGQAALPEAILMAYYAKTEVLSIDYRMPPDFPFPAAVDDTVAVWKELIKTRQPANMALFGTSAGGGLTLAAVLKLKELRVPLPGALMAGTPWADLTKTGDSYFTNEFVDNVLGSEDGELSASAKLYAGAHDLKEPLLSPVYGDLSGFPPTILLSGTRDLFLSNTVRVHQKMLQSGVKADLLVFEGQSHAQYLIVPDAPESAAAFNEIAHFLDQNLGRPTP